MDHVYEWSTKLGVVLAQKGIPVVASPPTKHVRTSLYLHRDYRNTEKLQM